MIYNYKINLSDIMSVFTAIHYQKRNDYSRSIDCDVEKFNSKDEAINHIMERVSSLDCSDQWVDIYPKCRELLAEGKAIWKWEWRRRGNGDYLQVVENLNDELNYILNLDLSDSISFDDMDDNKSSDSQ